MPLTTPAIQLEFLPYTRIFLYLTGFSSVWKRTPYIRVLSPFWPDLFVNVCHKCVLFLVSFSRSDTNVFCFSCHSADQTQIVRQFASCFNFPLKHVSVYHIVDLEWYKHRWSYNWGPCLWRDAIFHFVINMILRRRTKHSDFWTEIWRNMWYAYHLKVSVLHGVVSKIFLKSIS
jgi:hypothetical protein